VLYSIECRVCDVLCTVQYTTVYSVHHTVDTGEWFRWCCAFGASLVLHCGASCAGGVPIFRYLVLQVHRVDLCCLFMLRHGVSFTV